MYAHMKILMHNLIKFVQEGIFLERANLKTTKQSFKCNNFLTLQKSSITSKAWFCLAVKA